VRVAIGKSIRRTDDFESPSGMRIVGRGVLRGLVLRGLSLSGLSGASELPVQYLQNPVNHCIIKIRMSYCVFYNVKSIAVPYSTF